MTVPWSFSRLDALGLVQFVLLCLDGGVIWVWSLFKIFSVCFFFKAVVGCFLRFMVLGFLLFILSGHYRLNVFLSGF